MSEKTLKEKAQEILAEKTLKVVAENIKKDVTIYGVTGVYEGVSSNLNICNNFRLNNNDIIADTVDYIYIGDVNGRILSLASWTDNFDSSSIFRVENISNHTPETIFLYNTDKMLLYNNKVYPCWGVGNSQAEAESIISSTEGIFLYFFLQERSWGDDTISFDILPVTVNNNTKYYVIMSGEEFNNTTPFSSYRFTIGGGSNLPLTIYMDNSSYVYSF